MLITICKQTPHANINGPKNACLGSFSYGDPHMQISRAQIPICKSPFTNKYCSKTLNMNFMCIWSPHLQMVVVCIYGD